MSPRALQMIEEALVPLIRSGRRIERIQLYVCPESKIAEVNEIHTRFGTVRIKKDDYARKGLAYLLEDPGMKGRGFAWVSR